MDKRRQRGSSDIFPDAARSIFREPMRFARGALKRVWQMLGPDTFAIERLLDEKWGAYPDLHQPIRAGFVFALRVSFPLLVAFVVAGAVVTPVKDLVYLLPACGSFLASCLSTPVRATGMRYCRL